MRHTSADIVGILFRLFVGFVAGDYQPSVRDNQPIAYEQ